MLKTILSIVVAALSLVLGIVSDVVGHSVNAVTGVMNEAKDGTQETVNRVKKTLGDDTDKD